MADSPNRGRGPASRASLIRPRWWHDRRKLCGGDRRRGRAGRRAVAFAAYQSSSGPDDVNAATSVPFKQEKRTKVSQDHELADVRLRPRPHPLAAGEPGQAALQGAVEARGQAADRVPADLRQGAGLCEKRTKLGCGGRLFYVDNNGFAFSLDADTGKVIWKRAIAELNASSPPTRGAGCSSSTSPRGRSSPRRRRPARRSGSAPCRGARSPRPSWSAGGSSSADEDGEPARPLDPQRAHRSGPRRWPARSRPAPAYADGTALRRRLRRRDVGGQGAATAQIKWQAGSQGLSFSRTGASTRPPRSPSAASTAATTTAASTASTSETGELAWTQSTGGYVYPGPAVADTRETPPTVYIGSYDGNIYALDAKTGDERWSQSLGGPVIGSLSVIGNDRLRRDVRGHDDLRLQADERQRRSSTSRPAPTAGDLRRPAHLPDRLLEHHALQPVKRKREAADRAAASRAPASGGRRLEPDRDTGGVHALRFASRP